MADRPVVPIPSATLRGRCWRFGDNLSIDRDLMPFRFALARETRPEVLRDHVMTALDPDFPKKARPGDIVVAGRRFAQGNPHIQGFLGLRALGLGLVVESIPRGSLRNAVNAGVRTLPHCLNVKAAAKTGDELEVDFSSGRFRNITSGIEHFYAPLPKELQAIIEVGGWAANFAHRLSVARETVRRLPVDSGGAQ